MALRRYLRSYEDHYKNLTNLERALNINDSNLRNIRRAHANYNKINSKIEDPILPKINKSYGIMIAGIGGTGVVTIGAVLATAAQIDGRGSGVLDMTGLAQKGGAVKTFLRIFENPKQVGAVSYTHLTLPTSDLV